MKITKCVLTAVAMLATVSFGLVTEAFAAVPLYRMYLGGIDDHFYTTDAGERNNALNSGYLDEGIVGYVESSAVSGSVPLYRYFHPAAGLHFYTTNFSELGYGAGGYVYEGVQCHVYNAGVKSGTVPMYRYASSSGGHLYTTNPYDEYYGGEPIYEYVLVYSTAYGWTWEWTIVGFTDSYAFEGVQCYIYAP